MSECGLFWVGGVDGALFWVGSGALGIILCVGGGDWGWVGHYFGWVGVSGAGCTG